VTLAKGSSYVMILTKLPHREEYYLRFNPDYAHEATEENIKSATRAADPDKWAWGKSVHGLQMALLLPAEAGTFGAGNVPMGGRMKPSFSMSCGVALKNTSDKPLAISQYAPDHPLSVQAKQDADGVVGGSGEPVNVNLYPDVGSKAAGYEPKNSVILKPNQVMLIAPSDKADSGFTMWVSLDFGKWSIQAAFESRREDKGTDSLPLWKGKIESAPVEVEFKQIQPPPGLEPQ
jgi:hypothetical protein